MADNSGVSRPPPRDKTKKPPRMAMNMKRAIEADKEVNELKEHNEGLLFFDAESPSVRKRRENARTIFEWYCEELLGKENLTPEEMYNKETIVQRTSDWLFYCAKGAVARRRGATEDEKPKIGVLYELKAALSWWIMRLIPDFLSVFAKWHALTNASIQKAAVEMNFDTSVRPKNNLGRMELELFWKQIAKFDTGIENWKQHYVAWLMVFITSVRPGSFTVCPGYQKGALLPGGKTERTEDETLRWSDIQFSRHEGSVKCKINFTFIKGYRNPHSRKQVLGQRVFTMLPLNSNEYHFDLALLMTALAYSRGLFADVSSPEELFTGQLLNLQKVPDVDKQPVFVASNQAGTLEEDKAMGERNLTPKLQEMCNAVGLLQHNSMYSFRRSAIVESRRKHGTEHAQDIAFHVRGGRSIYSYDNAAFEDFDIVNDRLDLATMSRDDIRELFSQAKTSRVPAHPEPLADVGGSDTNLAQKLNIEAMRRARATATNVENEANLREVKAQANELLLSLGVEEVFLSNDRDLIDHLLSKIPESAECKAKLDEIRQLEKDNKNVLRRLQEFHKEEIKKELLKDLAETQTVHDKNQKNKPGYGHLTRVELEARGPDDGSVATFAEARRREIEGLSTEVTDEDQEQMQEEDEDEAADHTPAEPTQWEVLPDEVVVQQEVGAGAKPPTLEGRIAFVKAFIGKKRDTEAAGLACMQCHYDDTVPFAKQEQKYTLSSLDKHLKSDYHSRESQVLRAFEIDKDEDGTVDCPFCRNEKGLTKRKFIAHYKKMHDEMLAF